MQPTAPSTIRVRLRLAGVPRVELAATRDARPLAARDAALLAWLALEGPTPRARLGSLLWPDSDVESARNTLRQRLFQLRRAHGVPLVVGQAVLALAEGIDHDLHDADTVLGAATGEDLAPGEFAQWLEAERARRRDRTRHALTARAEAAEAARDWADALTHARALLALDPLSEEAHRRVMRLHYLAGDRAAALLAFDACERLLKDEVGTRPSPETMALLGVVERADATGAPVPPRGVPAGLLRPPTMVGRDAELARVVTALAQGRVAFVVGEAGMGKTRLLEVLRRQQPSWVYASARPGDASVPFAAIGRALRQVAQSGGVAPAAFEPAQRRELARLLPDLASDPPRAALDGQRAALEHAVLAYLQAQHRVEGLLLDDLHFADTASLELLSALLAGDGQPAFRCALAFRPAEAGSPLVALQDALLDRLNLEIVALAPLDAAALAALVDSLGLPGVDGASLAPLLHRRTGGSPMFAIETLKQAWAEDRLGALQRHDGRLPAPASLGRLIERRLAQLSPAALALARVASIASVDFDVALAEQVLATPAMHLADAINELETAHVLRGRAFAHDLVFEAVRAGVPATVAVRTHGQVAAWLEGHGGEPARVAGHWLAAEQPARAVEPLRAAARRSAARTAYAEAAVFLEQAIALCRSLGRRDDEFELLDELVDQYALADPGAAADAAVTRMAALAQGERERLRAQLARHHLGRRRQEFAPPAELLEQIEQALQLGERGIAGSLVVICSGALTVAGDPTRAVAVLEQHRELLEGQGPDADMASLLANLGTSLAGLDRFAEAIDLGERGEQLFREAGDTAEVMRSLCNRTRYYRAQGRVHTALAAFETVDRWHAADAPNPAARAMTRCSQAEVLCDLELYDRAILEVERDLALGLRVAGPLALAWPVARARTWLALGQHARAMQALSAAGAQADTAPAWLAARWWLLQAQVEARLQDVAGGRPGERAWSALDAAVRLAPRDQRRLSWFECELQRAAWSAPADGAARAEMVAELALAQGMLGHALHARYRAAERMLADGRPGDALRLRDAGRMLSRWRFADSQEPEPVHPSGSSRAEIEWIDLQVSSSLGDAAAPQRAHEAAQRLRRVAMDHVPAEFRDGFLHRHPVHRALLALAARLGSA